MRLNKLPAAICLTTLCSLSALTAGGCAEDRTTLFISNVMSLGEADDCEIDVSLAADGLSKGRYNSAIASGYRAALLIGNGMQALADNDTLKPETSRIQIEGAEIYVCQQTLGSADMDDCIKNGGSIALEEFSTYFSGTVHPDDSEDPGLLGVSVPLIPSGLEIPTGDYRLSIEVFGTTMGGRTVESGKFIFPLLVVNDPDEVACIDIDSELAHGCGWWGQEGYPLPLCLYAPDQCGGLCGN